jgi:hypothetical protein
MHPFLGFLSVHGGNGMRELSTWLSTDARSCCRLTSREVGEARWGAKGMGLEPALNQTSKRQCSHTLFFGDDDDVAYTSPFKRGL